MKLLIESYHTQDCTLGRIFYGNFQCFTLELPWLGNSRGISAIPAGTYEAFKRESPKNGSVVELLDVPNRTHIQIHAGNYTRQIEGCILVGDGIKFLDSDNIPDVTNSRHKLTKLLAALPDEFEIEIKRAR